MATRRPPDEGRAPSPGDAARSGRRAWRHTALLLLAVALAASVWRAGAGATRQGPPRLLPDASVGSDLAALAEETWDLFLGTFAAHHGCIGDVRLRAVTALHGRAVYDPATATVTVQVPGTRAMLQSALVHEWAHHLEFACPAHGAMRPTFLAAQRLPPETPWRPDPLPATLPAGRWAEIPSEQFAEAAVALVLEGRPVPTNAHLTPEAIDVVARWAAGRSEAGR